MKKRIIFFVAALLFVFLLVPAATQVRAAGTGFDAAIQAPAPAYYGEEAERVNGEFEYFTQAIYFTFTAASDGIHHFFTAGRANFQFYDSSHNRIGNAGGGMRTEIRLQAGNTYYVRVVQGFPNEHAFNIADARTFNFSVRETDRGFTADEMASFFRSYWWVLLIIVAYTVIIMFPYRRYIDDEYDGKAFGWPFTLSLVMSALLAVFAIFGVLQDIMHWIIAVVMVAALVTCTVRLLIHSKKPHIVLINTVLMALLYVGVIVTIVAVLAVAIGLMFLILFISLLKGGGGGGGGRTCARCGKVLGTAVNCGCGMSTS